MGAELDPTEPCELRRFSSIRRYSGLGVGAAHDGVSEGEFCFPTSTAKYAEIYTGTYSFVCLFEVAVPGFPGMILRRPTEPALPVCNDAAPRRRTALSPSSRSASRTSKAGTGRRAAIHMAAATAPKSLLYEVGTMRADTRRMATGRQYDVAQSARVDGHRRSRSGG